MVDAVQGRDTSVGTQYLREALFKGRNIQEFSVGDTSVGDTSTLHPATCILSRVGTHRPGTHCARDISSKGRMVYGPSCPRKTYGGTVHMVDTNRHLGDWYKLLVIQLHFANFLKFFD